MKTPARMRQLDLPRPGFVLLLRRIVVWAAAVFRYWVAGQINRIRGVDETVLRGPRLRSILEGLGGTAIKIGHEISMRVDIIPLDVCNELAIIPDRAPAMDLAYAVERIEAASGRPLEQQFEILDPEPIVSDTVSCVYQAILKNGDRVAVKVRRPGVLTGLSADLSALGWLLGLLEFLTLVRPGTFVLLERELRLKLGEELDFLMAARYQRLFRRRARRDGLKFLSAARIHAKLSSSDVMVSEFIAGMWCHEVMAENFRSGRVEAESAVQDINPRVVARRLLQAMWWAQFENPFFPVEPRARNIVIQPGNKIVFVNLGECGRVSGGKLELYREALRRLTESDVSGATDALLQMLAPLPYIETHDFRSKLERGLWQHLFSLRHRESPRWERTSTRLWLDLFQTAHQFGIPVRLEVVRLMRSVLMTEHVASHLWPRMNLIREFIRYQRRADRRKVESSWRQCEFSMMERDASAAAAEVTGLVDSLKRFRFWLDSNTRTLPVQFMSLSAKGAFALSAVIKVIGVAVFIGIISFLALLVNSTVSGEDLSLSALAGNAIHHPFFIVVMTLFGVLTLRRVLFRLGDRDLND